MNCPACGTTSGPPSEQLERRIDSPSPGEPRWGPGATACPACGAALPCSCVGCGRPLVAADGEVCSNCRTERLPDPIDPRELFPHVDDPRSAGDQPMFDLGPRFIDRGGALAALEASVRGAIERNRIAFLLVTGEPGMGKSRLVAELWRRVGAAVPEARLLAGSCAFSRSVIAEVLESRFAISPSDDAAAKLAKITAGVGDLLPEARVTEVAHLLAHLMRVPIPESPVLEPLSTLPQRLETRTFMALRRFFAADAQIRPLCLCFENLDSAHPETINLIHYLAAGLENAPVTIVGTASPDLAEYHPSFGDIDVPLMRIELGPLSDADADALVAALGAPLSHIPEALLLRARALASSPRAIYELFRLLLETDTITYTRGAWHIDEARLASTSAPTSHDELSALRIAGMPAADRDILERAACVGESFWLDAVVALTRMAAPQADPDGPRLSDIAQAGDHTRVTVAEALARLAEREWIVEAPVSSMPGEREYRFVYPNLWATTYARIDEARRRASHRAVAQWLELRPEGRDAAQQEEIGRHLGLAGDGAGASARLRRAADAARQGFFNDKAIRLYTQALTHLAEADVAARIHLWHDLGSVYELCGRFEAALGAFERMLRLSWVCAARTKAAVAFNKMGRVWRRRGNLELALEYLERGQELFDQAGDARGIAGSLDDIGHVLYLLGRYDDAHAKVQAGLDLRGKDGDRRSVAHSLSNLGNIQKNRGRIGEALGCHTEALELRRAINDRAGVISSLNNLAVLAFERGDLHEARSGWEHALTEAENIGSLSLQALALTNLGELALVEGRPEEARSRLEDALDIAEDIDEVLLSSEATRNLALLEHSLGNTEAARELAQDAHDAASQSGLREAEGRALLALAEVQRGALFDADTDQPTAGTADHYFERGVALLRDLGNNTDLARALERFGRHKLEAGHTDQGVTLLREAEALYARLGMKQAQTLSALLSAL